MNENSQNEVEETPSGSQGDVIFLLKRLQEQMTFLERKVDLLLAQSKEKERERPAPAYDKERSYSKSYTPRPYNSERREGRYEGRSDSRSEGRPSYGSKSAYGSKPPARPSYGSKPYGASGAGFAGKKKPFFKNRER